MAKNNRRTKKESSSLSFPNSSPSADTWKHRHLLDIDQLSSSDISVLFDTAQEIEMRLEESANKKLSILEGITVMTLFYEPSTRTRISFEAAGKKLSADVINISAPGSSMEKGESLLDTFLTLQSSGADILVVRHGHSGAPYLAAKHLANSSVINAGDGEHAHPTQALLDLFTMQKHLGNLRGRQITLVGDVIHSRVARSLLLGLRLMGAYATLCGPPSLLPSDSSTHAGASNNSAFPSPKIEQTLTEAIRDADVIIPLRIQKERHLTGLVSNLKEYSREWQINKERLIGAKRDPLIMHPGPVNAGVEISMEVAQSSQSLVQEQVANGRSIRMALLYLLSIQKGA